MGISYYILGTINVLWVYNVRNRCKSVLYSQYGTSCAEHDGIRTAGLQ
jgi:hypothetical protein